ncbi:armadillo repeat-containing protein 1-like [Ptychodera flava]|uniref:armadillo repeat-containing protein 1-like n=1 Tax=Ptychodera flava TaxID=63121 RepID=UPI00396A9885
MDAGVIVQQLRTLAADPQNRDALVKDQASMQGLVYFLDNKDSSVIMTSLEALQDLSENPSNRPVMRDLPYVVDALQDTLKRQHDKRIQHLARKILSRISPANHSPLKNHVNNCNQTTQGKTNKYKKTHFLGNANKRAKTVTLQVKGLNDLQCRKICEELLLPVKGVISFTFDMSNRRCILRVKTELKPEVLVTAIAKSKIMSAEQVIKDEYGQEVLLSFGANPATVDKENDSLPQYLPEDDSPIKGADKAVVRTDNKKTESSWVASAAKFLSQSFYW